jgi:hypothetical protein
MYPSDLTSLLAAARTDASSSMIEITGTRGKSVHPSFIADREQSVSPSATMRRDAARENHT